MHALIVTAHPDPEAFTHVIAKRVIEGIRNDRQHTCRLADLAEEKFDPSFKLADYDVALGRSIPEPRILCEQQRIEEADALVLIFPIYWWSMPALMKGWIDRVFTQGWAKFDDAHGTKRLLGGLSVHLIGVGGADPDTYERRGYRHALETQVSSGIFSYCGAHVTGTEIFNSQDAILREEALNRAFEIGSNLPEAIKANPLYQVRDIPPHSTAL